MYAMKRGEGRSRGINRVIGERRSNKIALNSNFCLGTTLLAKKEQCLWQLLFQPLLPLHQGHLGRVLLRQGHLGHVLLRQGHLGRVLLRQGHLQCVLLRQGHLGCVLLRQGHLGHVLFHQGHLGPMLLRQSIWAACCSARGIWATCCSARGIWAVCCSSQSPHKVRKKCQILRAVHLTLELSTLGKIRILGRN